MAFTGPTDRDFMDFVHDALAEAKKNKDGVIPIVEVGDPVLRQPWNEFTGQISARAMKKLIPVMRTTMLKAPGVGLAAPQIGLPLAFAVVEDHVESSDDSDNADDSSDDSEGDSGYDWSKDPREFAEFPFHVIINPHYEPIGKKTASFYEGCLSLPGVQAVRRRWLDIHATWQDENGVKHEDDLHGWPARIFQHETDHLSGEVYIDRAEIRSISTEDNMYEYGWADPSTLKQEQQILGFRL